MVLLILTTRIIKMNFKLFARQTGSANTVNKRNKMKKLSILLPLFTILILLQSKTALGQNEAPLQQKEHSFRFMTGISRGFVREDLEYLDFGVLIFGEYKREIGKNWFYGISFDGMIPFVANVPSRIKNLSVNAYYRLPLVGDRLFLMKGFGLGSNFIFRNDEHLRVGPALNASISMSWRVRQRIYLEFSPFILIPGRLNFPVPDVLPQNLAITLQWSIAGVRIPL